jgi:hypothetical protein
VHSVILVIHYANAFMSVLHPAWAIIVGELC